MDPIRFTVFSKGEKLVFESEKKEMDFTKMMAFYFRQIMDLLCPPKPGQNPAILIKVDDNGDFLFFPQIGYPKHAKKIKEMFAGYTTNIANRLFTGTEYTDIRLVFA